MKSLEKWQIISFISRGVAMVFGIVQSFVILRILTVGEWGLIQLVVSIGASLGIYQHLGLASASNREIAAAEKKTDVFKIFATTLSVRYLVTIPLSVGLYFFAPKISQTYGFAEIILPLRLYAVTIFLQGIQAILNAVISGTKRFKELFIFQGAIALASIIIYVPLVYKFKIIGFFYALVIHELIKSVSLAIVAFKPYVDKAKLPTKKEFLSILKDLFSLGMSIYLVKIIVINWEKFGANAIGLLGDAHLIGIYSFALLYAKKLMHVSDAVTDVNLPVFSSEYANDIKKFKILFSANFNKIFSIIVFSAMSAVFWANELISILIGSSKYNDALPLLTPMVFAFIFFSLLNVVTSSVAIPAKAKSQMIFGYACMVGSTVLFYILGNNFLPAVIAMAYAMFVGALVGFLITSIALQKKLKFSFFRFDHLLIVVQALGIGLLSNMDNFVIKVGAYIISLLLFSWALTISKIVSRSDILAVINKGLKVLKIKS